MPILTALIFLLTATRESTPNEEITVIVSGIEAERGGNLMVLIFSEKGFPIEHRHALAMQSKKVTGKTMIFKFKASVTRQLAFKALHDEDSNHKVTKNWTGIIPAEGLGFSRGAKLGAFGPPDFEDAEVTRTQALKHPITLQMIYP